MSETGFPSEDVQTFRLRDGRALAFKVYGALLQPRKPRQVLYFHGVPSCHMEAEALDQEAKELGVSVVSMDRAGVGCSDFQRGRSLQSTAHDAHQLLQHLQMERVVVVGTSGGGPYAAAFAALHPQAVDCLVLISAVGPTDWSNLPLLRAMRGADFLQFSLARLPAMGGLWALHCAMAYMAKNHTNTLLEHAPEGMAAADGEVLRSDSRVREAFGRCLQHAYRGGARGMAHDVRVLGGKWGVDLSSIECRVMVWQGADDLSVPVRHAEWWAQRLPGSKLTVLPGEGHVTLLLRHGGNILRTALHWTPQPQQQPRDEQPQEQQITEQGLSKA